MTSNVVKSDQSYDGLFKQAEGVKFLPFVGPLFRETSLRETSLRETSLRILMLGESHYGPQENNRNTRLTRSLVEDDYLSASANGRRFFWTKGFRRVAAMIGGKDYYSSDNVWQQLAFYNFFQQVVGDNAKDKKHINEQTISEARSGLQEVCKILEPNLVIVWGIGRLYDTWLPREMNGVIPELRVFQYQYLPKTVFWAIHHPSIGFSIPEWHEKFLKVRKSIELSGDR